MTSNLQQCFRWFGPSDPVTLKGIKQTGVTGIVTALHHVPCGDIWTVEEIRKRKDEIAAYDMEWVVVESVNVHEDIKINGPARKEKIGNYITTLKNLAHCGIKTVCYNFMPVLDWTRTHLDYRLPTGVSALRFDQTALAAFDLFILERDNAWNEYGFEEQRNAKKYYDGLTKDNRALLRDTVLAGLPGTDEVYSIAQFRTHLERYRHIGISELKDNLKHFLCAVVPSAESLGIKMCIHPDDPPFPILGLPRIACNEQDLLDIVSMVRSPSNGITLCTGSLGARPDNDLPGIIARLGNHIHFLHLRNVRLEQDGSFYEAEHLEGSTNMFEVMRAIIAEQLRRTEAGNGVTSIPMRPDHGHKIWTDFQFDTYPGYSLIGRLKGLAELKGLEMGIKMSLQT